LFGFCDEVRIRISPETVERGIAGKLGAVLGISEPDDERVPMSYAVDVDGLKNVQQIKEEELEGTGLRRKRKDYFSGKSLRVSRGGRVIRGSTPDGLQTG